MDHGVNKDNSVEHNIISRNRYPGSLLMREIRVYLDIIAQEDININIYNSAERSIVPYLLQTG